MKQISLLAIVFMCFSPVLAQEIEKAVTIIKTDRQVTESEKAYGKAYAGNRSHDRGGKKLSQVPFIGDYEAYVHSSSHDFFYPYPFTKGQMLERWVCGADAVITGRAGSKTIHLTEDETLVYSEYEFKVEGVIKNTANLPIQVGNNIQVTRPGGNIRFNDRLITFIDGGHLPLQNGKNYLLFLKYAPGTNGYIPSDEGSDYLLDENKAKLTIRNSTKGVEVESEDADSLLNLVRAVTTSPSCKQK